MKTPIALALPLSLFVLSACGGGGGASSSDEFADACEASTNMPREVCECAGEKALAELEPDAVTFLVAMMNEETDRAEELREKLGVTEAVQAGMFMASGPARCAAEMGVEE